MMPQTVVESWGTISDQKCINICG